MKQKTITVRKPDFHSDIYRIINDELGSNDNNLIAIRQDSERKQFVFFEVINQKRIDYNGNQTIIVRDYTRKEMIEYITKILKEYSEDKLYQFNYCPYTLKQTRVQLKMKESLKQPHKIKELTKGEKTIKVGDLLYTSWGYDQTNVETYKIVRIIGKNYFVIQQTFKSTVEGTEGHMCRNVKPTLKEVPTLPEKAFIDENGYMNVCEKGYQRTLFQYENDKQLYNSWYH